MTSFLKILCFVSTSVCLLAGCSPAETRKKNMDVPVLVARAAATNVPVRIEPPPVGHVMPVQSVTIRPQTGGTISAVNFREGQEVRAGDLLFTIDSRPAQAALDSARAALQRDAAQLGNAKIQFDREKKLFEAKLVSQDEFDTARAAYDALAGTIAADEAGVTNAQLNLEYTKIRAPIEGRTGGVQFHEGNVVKAPDDVLVTINLLHPIYAAFAVPERFLPEIQRQQQRGALAVTASYENMDGEPSRGELTFVDNAVDEMTGTIQLKATFANTDAKLWPGQFVQISLTLSELTNAVLVPSQAVQAGQGGSFVFVVKTDHTVESRPVKTGISAGSDTVITSGLNAGETVVTDGQLRLVPGVKVDVKK